jgi:hypothetical protein
LYRVLLGFDIVPLDGGDTGLRVAFQAGPEANGGRAAMEIVISPIAVPASGEFSGWSIQQGLRQLGDLFGIPAVGKIAALDPPFPWDKLFKDVKIAPSLRLQPVGSDPSVRLEAQLFLAGQPPGSGITVGGEGPLGITVEPKITVYDLVAGYSSGGLDLKARVLFHPMDGLRVAGRTSLAEPETGKPQLVSYPFPLPGQNQAAAFRLEFLGLGQRFAPTIDVNKPDPIKSAFDALEQVFTSDDPRTIINTLVADYYKPDVGWFFALHLDVRGFTVRAVLADPVLYGLEITCEEGSFKGLVAEILYQKIGADLGVFYGKIVLPDQVRQINVGAGSATIPSFEIWIYTNGDFKVAVGWPLGPNSFSLQVYVFMGEGGLYFGKLRSGDNPTGRTQPQNLYNPILVFGLALKVGIGRSIRKGPISAEASLTLQGVFQGLLAWKSAGSGAGDITREPDYYWFSASVTLAGVVQGSVDLGIISAGVSITVWATIATAFETKCNTVVYAEVGVDVAVTLKIVFVKIHIHFSATLDLHFTLIGGHDKDAALDGPSDPDLRAFIPQARLADPIRPSLRSAPARLAAEDKLVLQLGFMLQPAVPYDGTGKGTTAAVATLLIPSPDPAAPAEGTDFGRLVDLVSPWLLATWGGPDTPEWKAVAEALGPSGRPAPPDFEDRLSVLLRNVTFNIAGIDLSQGGEERTAAIFPMLDQLKMTVGASSWTFGKEPLTYSRYPEALADYFATLSALTPKPPASSRLAEAAPDGPNGPSLSHLLFVNWFLSLARQIASAMAGTERESTRQHGALLPQDSLPDLKTVASIAGMLSRMALHGARLPDPAVVRGPEDKITESIIHPLYALDYQQFLGEAGAALTATLSLDGEGLDIVFAAGDGATALLPGGTVPDQPDPGWRSDSPDQPGLVVTALDPLVEGPLTFSVTSRTEATGALFPGDAPPAVAQVLAMPASALPHIADGQASGTLRLHLQKPGDSVPPPATPSAPGLLIPMGLRRVPIVVPHDLDPEGSGAAPKEVAAWSKEVYGLIGTDDDTRDLLERAIAGGKVRRIVPLTLQDKVLKADPLDLDHHPVLAFKSNLSTTSQPNALFTPMMLLKGLAGSEDLGPCAARLDKVTDFLRLIWEVSVVHTGGFYLRYQDAQGNGLPTELFDKEVARFWLWLDLGEAGDAPSIPPYANMLVIAGDSDAAKSTQYLSLTDGGGPVVGWRPAYPPGCVGARILWNRPPSIRAEAGPDDSPWSQAAVDALYHMVELQIGGGDFDTTLWSTALSPVEQSTDKASVTYRQVVPAWRYLSSGASSPYAAVGAAVPLNFRLSDVYGNVLEDPSRQFSTAFPVVYNDPLLAPSAWPGCEAAYDMAKDESGSPVLSVLVTFDPAALSSHMLALRSLENGAALADQALQSAREAWSNVALQVHDPNFGASVSTSLYGDAGEAGDWPVIGDPAETLAALRILVDKLNGVVQGPEPARTTASFSIPIDRKRIASRPTDIFCLGVRLTLQRRGVDPEVARRLPAVERIEPLLPPLLPRTKSSDEPAPLVTWARQVEQALKAFDGGSGEIKLAHRPSSSAGDAAADVPGLWAVRLSASAGIAVAAGSGGRAFFTMEPFSTSLQYGSVDVTTWDEHLQPATAASSPASVDPDLLARGFLSSFDRLMAPDLAAGIARHGGSVHANAFDAIMGHKAEVARLLSGRLVPVYLEQASGDPGEAAIQFEQSLLAQLSNAYATAAIVQVPLEVSVAGTAEAGSALPPRFYGGLAVKPGAPQDGSKAPPVGLNSPKLALDGASAPWLTLLASVKEPEKAASIEIERTWTVSHIEHDIDLKDQHFGYVPSGWLAFVNPDPAAPSLNVDLGTVPIPVPLRQYPALPQLVAQTASRDRNGGLTASAGPIEDAIRKALHWPLTLTIGKPEQFSQDDLWVTSTFNRPLDWQPAAAAGPGPMTPLTRALVRFQAGFASLVPLLPMLEGDDPAAAKLVDVLVDLIGDVVSALSAGPLLAEGPGVEKLIWVLRYAEVAQNKLTVFGRVDPPGAATPLQFPVINLVPPDGPPQPAPASTAPDDHPWQFVTYTFPARTGDGQGGVPKQLELAVAGLDLLTTQTVIGSASVTRNADLGARVNPLLVYSTPEIFFSNVLAPFVEVTGTLGPMPAAPVAQMLADLLEPFTEAGTATGQQRFVRVAIAYNYPAVQAAGAEPLLATMPVLLDAGEPIGDDPSQLAGTLAAALEEWARAAPLPRAGATFSVSASLFVPAGGGHQIPLLTLDRIDLTAPDGWPD